MTLLTRVEAEPLLANARGRSGWQTHKATEDMLLNLARSDAMERRNRRPRLTAPVVLTLVVHPPERDKAGRRRPLSQRADLDGYAPTLKRLIDGAVLAGWLRDDSPDVVTEVRTRYGKPGDGWRLELWAESDVWAVTP